VAIDVAEDGRAGTQGREGRGDDLGLFYVDGGRSLVVLAIGSPAPGCVGRGVIQVVRRMRGGRQRRKRVCGVQSRRSTADARSGGQDVHSGSKIGERGSRGRVGVTPSERVRLRVVSRVCSQSHSPCNERRKTNDPYFSSLLVSRRHVQSEASSSQVPP
jgi:hypothetical protein